MQSDVMTLSGEKAGTIELKDDIFGLDPRADILQRVVVWQLAKARAGSRKTQTRSEVSFSTKKIVRQKGSGGARHGDKKVAQFRKGAKAHGPVVRDHGFSLTKKVRALGLKHALSAKAKAGELIVLDAAAVDAIKTKTLRDNLAKLGAENALVIDADQIDRNFEMSARNLPLVTVLPSQGINVRDILKREKLVLTKAAVEKLEARLS